MLQRYDVTREKQPLYLTFTLVLPVVDHLPLCEVLRHVRLKATEVGERMWLAQGRLGAVLRLEVQARRLIQADFFGAIEILIVLLVKEQDMITEHDSITLGAVVVS